MLNSSYFFTFYFLLFLISCTAITYASPDDEISSNGGGNTNNNLATSTIPQQQATVNNNDPNAVAPTIDNHDAKTTSPDTSIANGDYADDTTTKAPPMTNVADKSLPKPKDQQNQGAKIDDNKQQTSVAAPAPANTKQQQEQNAQGMNKDSFKNQKDGTVETEKDKQKALTNTAQSNGPRVKIQGENDFCFFLPAEPNQEVAPTEDYGVPYCTSESVVKGNKVFPSGFIEKTHYSKTSKYVQVTGYLDPAKYGLLPDDEGGQYDDHGKGKPIGAKCEGYNYFVNLLEPSNHRFCIRCCKSKSDCNTGRSQYGCINVIPGDYSDDELVEHVFDEIVKQEKQMKGTNQLQQQIDALVQLSSQESTTPKQMKAEWGKFIQQLQSTYPSESGMLDRVSQTTDWFTTTAQWWYFLSNMSLRIHKDESQ